eukprot:maker-scaffold_18-snap-gene-4.43-mRNA-1 protein AED:0.02 eAED:0.02 QI:86/1/1/1/0.5/0.4/5/532/596
MSSAVKFFLIFLLILREHQANEDDHMYKQGDEVVLWINRIGPYYNPQETYFYYQLPFCKPDEKHHKVQKYADIGELLEGHEMVESGMHMFFGTDQQKTFVCKQTLKKKHAAKFKKAVDEHYWYQFFLDDLPIWGMVGDKGTEEGPEHKDFIYTHRQFTIGYNGNRVIEVNLTSEEKVEILDGMTLEFSYGVRWVPVDIEFKDRFHRYLDYSFFEHQIHWFSIFNSFMMVIFLCGLVSLILMRTLKNDYAKYRSEEMTLIESDHFVDDSGWKQIHGDVFRPPKNFSYYAAVYGIGMQLLCLAVCLILIAIFGKVYVDQGDLISAGIGCYVVTSFFSGYFSGSLYLQYFTAISGPNSRNMKGNWIKTNFISALFLPAIVFCVSAGLNMVSFYYKTITVVPMKAMFFIFLLWGFVAIPIHSAGTVVGRRFGGRSNFPVRVNALPRQVPLGPWYTRRWFIIMASGWLPFASIFIEMYFILSSFWNYKFYYVFGFMFLVVLILCTVTACVTIFSVYVLLNAEDHRWHWVGMFSGASVGFYVFLYSVYYFYTKTNMTGFMQTSYYFSYMGIFCLGLSLMCGAVGTYSSTFFVKTIYRNIHID